MSLVNEYPYTNFHDVNLDYILKLVRENAGLHLEIVGNKLVMKTADNSIVSSVTISFAETADQANTATQANYAATAGVAATAQHASTADTATSATTASEAVHAASADTATTATTATNATNAVYATSAGSATNATNAVNAQNAAYAETTGNVEKAGNGVKAAEVTNSGQLWLDLENGGVVSCDVKRAKSAEKDSSGNNINTTYIASVVDDNGVLKFKNANGAVLFSITPSSQSATTDSYGNTIADFIKAITAPSDSNYVTVQHGTGAAETLTINYSNAAWKDTNGNIIKNFYAGSMEIVEDAQTGHYNLVVYNGDTPKAELYRFEIMAYKAQEAEEADHAATADYATEAGTAQNAVRAASAATSDTSAYFIDCYDNNDGAYSVANPDTITIEHVYDNNGNEVSLSDITADNYHNVYFRLRASQNATEVYTYTADTSYKVGSPNSPVFFKTRIIDDIDRTDGVDSISYINIEVGILNGAVATSKLFVYSETITSKIVQVEIKDTDTDPLSLTVGQDSDYETDIDAGAFFADLSNGKIISLRFKDEQGFSQGSAILNGTGGPAVIMLYASGVGPAWFRVGNNSTYTTGLNLERLS